MISSGSTMMRCAHKLIERGAREVYAAAVHPILSGDARALFDASPIRRLYVTDTLPISDDQKTDRLEVLTVAPLLAEAIMRIHKDLSISALFN
jgi:ribose-phosphate pyrophosphokinase